MMDNTPTATPFSQGLRELVVEDNGVEITAKDSGAQIIFAPTINGKAEFNFDLSSLDSNAAQNKAAKEIQALRESQMGLHQKVLLYWYQTRNDTVSAAGDRAIIESISSSPLKTVFVAEPLKASMLAMDENIFKKAFLVDVLVETIGGVPKLYKIQAVHEAVDRD